MPVTPAIQLEIDALIRDFRIDEGAYRALLQGPVARDLVRRGIRVEAAAKRRATGAPPSAPGDGPGVVTGRLRGSITWRLFSDAQQRCSTRRSSNSAPATCSRGRS